MASYNLRTVLKMTGQNILNWVKSNCVNNLLSTSTNLPLAAAQGKVLDEKIGQVTQSLSSKVNTTDSRLSDARTPKAHTHDDRYYTESEINSKVNPLYNIGRGDTVGKIYKYGDSAHTVGITWKEYSTSYAPIPRLVFDGQQNFDVIPNNPGTNNYKIINCWTSVQNGGTFRLNFIIYIDGTYYTRYINLS